MPKCSYCGKEYKTPRGLTLIMNDGNIKYLCSSKCRKNMLMKRRKVKWIKKKEKEVSNKKETGEIENKKE
ncbi:MAG: 50S ribosomal protein L24e [Nanoarchaeota archaeon]|nr:50S ribosomal protein L24e [Nanoarchaeota archaeon]